jgi:hypothetical protein
MVLIAIQLDRQPAIIGTLHHEIDRIATHGYLGANSVTKIQ